MSGTTGLVTFNYANWSALFPEFSNLNQTQATQYWTVAQQWCDNTMFSPVADYSVGGARDTYLNFLTAHVAFIFAGTAAQPAAQTVGRISDASEGSVSVSVAMPDPKSATEAWFTQTKYGFAFWSMTSQYRYGGLYMPPQERCAGIGITGTQFPGTLYISQPGWFV